MLLVGIKHQFADRPTFYKSPLYQKNINIDYNQTHLINFLLIHKEIMAALYKYNQWGIYKQHFRYTFNLKRSQATVTCH